MSLKAVFLDRDGVINVNTKPVNTPEDLVLYSHTAQSIRCLNKAGYLVFVITNQGGIEMGYFTEKDLIAIHNHMIAMLKAENAVINDIAYCPHYTTKCSCRKPHPGMILSLAKKYDVDLSISWVIGDFETDIEAGNAAGCRTIKIGESDPLAEYSCNDLKKAVEYILKVDSTKGL